MGPGLSMLSVVRVVKNFSEKFEKTKIFLIFSNNISVGEQSNLKLRLSI